jgi:hypothetical protein
MARAFDAAMKFPSIFRSLPRITTNHGHRSLLRSFDVSPPKIISDDIGRLLIHGLVRKHMQPRVTPRA